MNNQITCELFEAYASGEISLNVSWKFAFDVAGFSGRPDSERYIMSRCKCRICGEKGFYAFPVNVIDESSLECEFCEHLTVERMSSKEVWVDFVDVDCGRN